MNIQQFVGNLSQRGIRLWIEGDRLWIDAPKGIIDDALKKQLEARIEELVPHLQSLPVQSAPAPVPVSLPAVAPSTNVHDTQASSPDLSETLRIILAEVLLMDPAEIVVDEPMADLGLDSILLVEVVKRINERLDINIKTNTLYDYPSVTALSAYLVELVPSSQLEGDKMEASKPTSPIAPEAATQPTATPSDYRQLLADLKRLLGDVLLLDASAVEDTEPFADMGLDSILLVELVKRINEDLNLNIKADVLYDYPNAVELAKFLADKLPAAKIANPTRPTFAPKASQPTQTKVSTQPAELTSSQLPAPLPPHHEGTTCRGLLIRGVGDVADMSLQDVVVPLPGDSEIQIRVVASALNFPDVLCVHGLYPTMPDYPFVPGFEAAGWVERVGSGVTRFKVGDPVIAITGSSLGGHAQLVNTPETLAVRKPNNISFRDACALPVVFLTAWFSLCELGRMDRGDHVLIQTAAGGVGLVAVQLARLKGAVIYGTSSSPEKRAYLNSIGVDHVIDYTDPEFTQQVRSLSGGRGVDIVLNTLSGDMIQKGIDVLAPSGRYLEIAVAGLRASNKLKLSNMIDNQSFHSIDLRRLIKADPRWPLKYLDLMATMISENKLQPNVKQVFNADQAVDGLKMLANRTSTGKLVLGFEPEDAVHKTEETPNAQNMVAKQKGVAVVGISCRFPGSRDKDRFWENLVDGVVSTSEVPSSRWDINTYFDTDRNQPNKTYSKWGGFLEDVDQFDAAFFRFSPLEAERMDPQQRLFLEEAWHALEDAGYPTQSLNGLNCGIYVGASQSDYSQRAMLAEQDLGALNLVGNSNAVLASRISYFLNLSGPALTIDSACSSAAVAVHSGWQSIINGECQMAVVGGVSICTGPSMHIMASKMEILSPTGKSRTLDKEADGWVIGEGVGVLILKSLDKAQAAGDHIYGVIKASSVNQNGMGQGIVAPKAKAQIALQKNVYHQAGISPETIQYVEIQGTSTPMGDSIEVNALRDSFQSFTNRKGFCALGSLKPNIGHPLAASGVACLIKVLLSLHNKVIPKTLIFGKENPELDLGNSPFYINGESTLWLSKNGLPRRAAVNAFGFSGTNCHLVLEEAPPSFVPSIPSAPCYFIPFSAKTVPALDRRIEALTTWLDKNHQVNLTNVAYTLLAGRNHYPVRAALVVENLEELRRKLKAALVNPHDGLILRNDLNKTLDQNSLEFKQTVQQLTSALARPTGQEHRGILNTLADLYISGFDPDPILLYGKGPFKRISLPTYPFMGKSFWLEEKRKLPQHDATNDSRIVSQETDPLLRMQENLIILVADLLKVDATQIDPDEKMSELGFDSVIFIMFANKVNATYGLDVQPPIFYEFPSLTKLAGHLVEEHGSILKEFFASRPLDRVQNPQQEDRHKNALQTQTNQPIAIIGKSGVMPGSDDLELFWNNLERGTDMIGEVPADRWNRSVWDHRPFARWGGFMNRVDLFDAAFFGISPREADMMDPQQRLYLQSLWHCMEDAGYASETLSGSDTGVFVGMGSSDYFELQVAGNVAPNGHSTTGYLHSVLPNRISFLLDLNGPSEVINTACSSSLVAIERAVTSIRLGRCGLAFAGGVQVIVGPRMHLGIGSAGMLAPDGRCKTFAASADGYGRGEGVGVILLKSLQQAREDGDRIQAVIRGCAVNHGGVAQSLTAPNTASQARLLVEAYTDAAVDPASIGYIEAHGTGTKLGDPVEINGLKKAFKELYAAWDKPEPQAPHCGLGSVKSNIGHLESAAGISGVLKMILAIQNHKLPASLHLKTPNPYIDLKNSPFYLVDQTREWNCLYDEQGKPLPRRCGVSSFGFGGVNAHIVLEEYAEARPVTPDQGNHLLVLSAMNDQRLRVVVEDLSRFLTTHGDNISLPDLTYTLQVGRKALEVRLAMPIASMDEARQKLDRFLKGETRDIRIGNIFDGGKTAVKVGEQIHHQNLDELAQLWVEGAQVNWNKLYTTRPNRIGLPGYPFERKRFWFAEGTGVTESPASTVSTKVKPAPQASEVPPTKTGKDASPLSIRRQLGVLLAQLLHLEEAEINERKPFVDQGLDSILGVEFVELLNREFSMSEKAELLYSYPDIKSLAGFLAGKSAKQGSKQNSPVTTQAPVETPLPAVDSRQIRARIISLFAELLTVTESEINTRKPFVDQGLDSILSAEFIQMLNGEFHLTEKTELLYSYPTIDQLADYLVSRVKPKQTATPPATPQMVVPIEPQAPMSARELPAISKAIVEQLALTLCLNPNEINRHKPFVDQGLDSILSVEFTNNLNEVLAINERAELLYSYPTVESLATHLAAAAGNQTGGTQTLAQTDPKDTVANNRQAKSPRARMKEILAEVLCLEVTALDDRKPFADLGLDSILSVELIDRFNRELELNVKVDDLYAYPNMNSLVTHLEAQVEVRVPPASETPTSVVTSPGRTRTNAKPLNLKRPGAAPVGKTRLPGTKLKLKSLMMQSYPTPSHQSPPNDSVQLKPAKPTANCNIAVIGMACRFAGAKDTNAFWDLLIKGKTGVTEVPKNRWSTSDWYDPDPSKEGKTSCKWGGFLDNPANFDREFFDLSAEQATLMDPQQRIFLEEAWHALEHAGYSSERLSGSQCGVIVGVSNDDYGKRLFASANQIHPELGLLGNANAILPARIAYHLNLKGPALSLDTACSSSTVAIHLACRALRDGETDMMLAGGVTLYLNAMSFVVMSKAGMLSKRGETRAFDNLGDGFVPGEGVGVVVLKRLEDALSDHDTIHGVIKGSGLNQNGRSNGITAPNAESQQDLQQHVYKHYGIDPSTIDYVEAHGTGSKLGDSIEINALSASFGQFTTRKQFCGVGSVKSNLGHTTAAAGVAGLIKILLSLSRETLPPGVCFKEPNDYINFPETPFYVVEKARPWPRKLGTPRRAALNANSFSGTNSHLVVEESPKLTPASSEEMVRLYPFSARSETALRANISAVVRELKNNPVHDEHLARTLLLGRTHFEKRIAFVAHNVGHLIRLIREALNKGDDLAPAQLGEPVEIDVIEVTANDLANSKSTAVRREKAAALAKWYIAGEDLPWLILAGSGPGVILPGYVFDHQAYWIESKQEKPMTPTAQKERKPAKQASNTQIKVASSQPKSKPTASEGVDLSKSTQTWLTNLIEEHVEKGGPLKPEQSFVEYGVDSFLTLKIVKELEHIFGPLRKTLLFEKFTIKALSKWLLENHRDTLKTRFTVEQLVPPLENKPEVQTDFTATSENRAPTIILERRLDERSDLKDRVANIYRDHKDVTSVAMSRWEIAPFLFIGSDGLAYFNFNRKQDLLFVWAYTGPQEAHAALVDELSLWCQEQGVQMNIFGEQRLTSAAGEPLTATPISVMQRITDLPKFKLSGNKMRRLRYMVQKFEKAGKVHTAEYVSGHDPQTDKDIVDMVDRWCSVRTLINPFIHRIREDLLKGRLSKEHRIFITWLNDTLCNLIIITALKPGEGYLMDIEFYPEDMPLGGLEYTIVKMVEILKEEDCPILSLGGTFGAQVEESPNADPRIVEILEDLRAHGKFGQGNFQFKNKFRTENRNIYLCRPVDADPATVTDIMMMIADPQTAEESDVPQSASKTNQVTTPDIVEPTEPMSPRERDLHHAGYNPMNLDAEMIEFDLATDSWAELMNDAVFSRMSELMVRKREETDLTRSLKEIFPFKHVIPVASGRMAEAYYAATLPRDNPNVVQNLLFPTWIYHQINVNLSPTELPDQIVFDLNNESLFRANLDLDALRVHLAEKPIAFACIEVGNNASGGYPISLANLKEMRAILNGIPLVIDATRIMENSVFIRDNEPGHQGRDPWDIAREICALADCITASLAKDFCVNTGGIIATNDDQIAQTLLETIGAKGSGLTYLDRKLLGVGLTDRDLILQKVERRMKHVAIIAESLTLAGAPVVTPNAGHCVLLNIKAIKELDTFTNPLQSFLAWLYLNTGIRGGVHSVGLQKHSSLNNCIRLAIPVGLSDEVVAEMAKRLSALFRGVRRIPDLTRIAREAGLFGDVRARYAITTKSKGPFLQIGASQAERFNPFKSTTSHEPFPRKSTKKPDRIKEIAIVGISGRFPRSPNLEAFWENIREGRDCLTSLPQSRRELVRVEGDPDKIVGGYLEDVDRFDASFFNIDPEDAVNMDPQERLFLETAWSAMEDAGFLPEDLSDDHGARNVGVFAGAVWGHYQMIGAEQTLAGKPATPNSFHWSIANRVSYVLNLNGPSLTLDTACSSALTAVHFACESIRRGTCSMAFAGGVNLDLHPSKLRTMRADGVISGSGKTRSFGDEADGYVPGEGVGVLLLKSLAKALADGDHIHGTIKCSVMNHDGHGSGFTVPNPETQRALIEEALVSSQIDARTISYIEAHGTGTAMGDALEIQALSEAFASQGVTTESCTIGSVKTNIGHTEAASGIASIAKVLWQFREGELAPTLNAEITSPYIDFQQTPFRLQRQLSKWLTPALEGPVPLRAGISTFGAGGTNVHVILEAPPITREIAKSSDSGAEHLVILSAADEKCLHAYAERLAGFIVAISRNKHNQVPFENIAATLREGRRNMSTRLALIAASKEDAWIKLTRFLKGDREIEGLFLGHASEYFSDAPHPPLTAGEYERIADYWVKGGEVDWKLLRGEQIRRVSLPTYPFADERYWLSVVDPTPTTVEFDHTDQQNDNAQLEVIKKPQTTRISREEGLLGDVHARYAITVSAALPGTSPPMETDSPLNAENDDKPDVITRLREMVGQLVGRTAEEIDPDKDLKDYDFDSLTGMKLINRIHDQYGVKISILSFFEYGTVNELFGYLVKIGVVADEVKPVVAMNETSGDATLPVLDALRDGKISSEQANKLLEAIRSSL